MKTTYKGYVVHSDGRIEKKKGHGFIKPSIGKDGYMVWNCVVDGQRNYSLQHRFVWEAFNGPIAAGMTIDHIDEDKTNNTLDNLQMLTFGANASKSNQRLSKEQIDTIRYLKANTNYSSNKIAEEVGTSRSSVLRVLNNPAFSYVY